MVALRETPLSHRPPGRQGGLQGVGRAGRRARGAGSQVQSPREQTDTGQVSGAGVVADGVGEREAERRPGHRQMSEDRKARAGGCGAGGQPRRQVRGLTGTVQGTPYDRERARQVGRRDMMKVPAGRPGEQWGWESRQRWGRLSGLEPPAGRGVPPIPPTPPPVSAWRGAPLPHPLCRCAWRAALLLPGMSVALRNLHSFFYY